MVVSLHTMGHGRTVRIAALVVLLSLLVLDAMAFSTERASILAGRGLLDSEDTPRTIAFDLMHAHHVDSPFMQGLEWSLTMSERLQLSMANGKRRSLQAPDVFTSPLDVAAQEYNVQISVGTPARTFVAVADTGSDLVWLQCTDSTCTDVDCIETPDQPFDPSNSSSYTPLSCSSTACGDLNVTGNEVLPCPDAGTCTYNYSYGDGTFTFGELADETFTFTLSDSSTTPVSGIAMGCGTDDESMSTNGTDGLVGLGQGPLSLVSQLANSSIIDHVFSYCLVDYSSAITQTSPLLLGSTGNITKSYTPLVPNDISSPYSTYYYVQLEGITVNDQPISYPDGLFDIDSSTGSGGMIVDSGTTLTYLFEQAYNPFESAISALITYPEVQDTSSGLDLCYDTSSVTNPVFPIVVFLFESDVNVTLSTNNTFIAVDQAGTYCLAFANGGDPQTGPSIYGNIAQSHFEISFDVVNQEVGFGPGGC